MSWDQVLSVLIVLGLTLLFLLLFLLIEKADEVLDRKRSIRNAEKRQMTPVEPEQNIIETNGLKKKTSN